MTSDLIEFFDCEQGEPEWFALKLGIPSASQFSDVMAAGQGKVRDLYMRKLAGERLTGLTREDYRSSAMDRGSAIEPELRTQYALITDADPTPIGFVRRKMRTWFAGASPDSLVGGDGAVEYKSAAPHVLIEIHKAGRVPPEHLPQCQGTMFITEREWCDLAIGNMAIAPGFPGIPLFRRRIKRDPSYIARLEIAIETFNEQLDELVEWLRHCEARAS